MLAITNHFKQVLAQNQLAHAYIIDNITEGQSKSCFDEIGIILQVLLQDCHFITSESTSIGIDMIRDITQRLSKSPIGKLHLVGISPAEKMNTAACNALLKCLEEPPGNTCFLLFCHNAKHLLPTICSRTQILRSPSLNLDHYHGHPDYEQIRAIYQLNPASLDENLLGLKVYEALNAENPLLALHKLDIEPYLLIQLSIQILSSKILKEKNLKLWKQYDALNTLNKDFQQFKNLNEKGVLDRIGLILSHQ